MEIIGEREHKRTTFQLIESRQLADKIIKYLDELPEGGSSERISKTDDIRILRKTLNDQYQKREYWSYYLPQQIVTLTNNGKPINTFSKRCSDLDTFGYWLVFKLREDNSYRYSDEYCTTIIIYNSEKIDELVGNISDFKTELISFLPRYPTQPKILLPKLIEKIHKEE